MPREVVGFGICCRFQVDDGRALRAAAIAGHGIVLQPEADLDDDRKAGRPARVLADDEAPFLPPAPLVRDAAG